jgi:hypothetical protein
VAGVAELADALDSKSIAILGREWSVATLLPTSACFPAPETSLEMILTAQGRSRQRIRDSERSSGLLHDAPKRFRFLKCRIIRHNSRRGLKSRRDSSLPRNSSAPNAAGAHPRPASGAAPGWASSPQLRYPSRVSPVWRSAIVSSQLVTRVSLAEANPVNWSALPSGSPPIPT